MEQTRSPDLILKELLAVDDFWGGQNQLMSSFRLVWLVGSLVGSLVLFCCCCWNPSSPVPTAHELMGMEALIGAETAYQRLRHPLPQMALPYPVAVSCQWWGLVSLPSLHPGIWSDLILSVLPLVLWVPKLPGPEGSTSQHSAHKPALN